MLKVAFIFFMFGMVKALVPRYRYDQLTRLTWFLIDKNDYLSNQRNVGEAYRRVFGRHFPAMSVVVVKELIEDEALIEIEATAEL